jgi:dTDP-4-dehydrorhamnose reductase
MTWLVTGAQGMLGTDLRAVLERHRISYEGVDLGDLDLLDGDAVAEAVAGHEVVVNCAAWTAVDKAEDHEPEAFMINAVAPALLARAVRRHDARIIHVSTDYVFAGDATAPYPEDGPAAPASAYGRTKAAGEWAVRAEAPEQHLITRTAWLYGAHGGCFPKTIARVAAERGAVSVVDDQHGQPTWTTDLAEAMVRLVQADAEPGTWHTTSSGQTTWCEFAREVVAAAGLSRDVVSPTDSAAFQSAAPRPAYSVLGHDRWHQHGIEPIGDWRERWSVASGEVLALDEAD